MFAHKKCYNVITFGGRIKFKMQNNPRIEASDTKIYHHAALLNV